MATLTLRLLGSFQAALDGGLLRAFDSDKVRGLLAYLAVESGEAQQREKLAGLFWPESPDRRARASLSQALYNLRAAIGDRQAHPPFLIVRRDAIQFNTASDHWLDVAAFTQLIGGSQAHDHASLETCAACIGKLGSAAGLYRDDFLADLHLWQLQAFHEWRLVTRERLHREIVEVLGILAGCHERRGENDQAFLYAWRCVELDPLTEAPRRQIMRLLAARGQQSQALSQYEIFYRTLAQELGVEPAPETTALYERLRAESVSDLSLESGRHNLPAHLTPFIGRRRESNELLEHLLDPDCRLLTVVGPGGSGKTRLAQEVARAALPHFNHGVYLVSLNPLGSPDSIYPAIASALDFPLAENEDTVIQLQDYLRAKELLLVMDGFEHLLEAVPLLTELLKSAPGIKVLATSRARLNVKGEHLQPLMGMACPKGDEPFSQAVQADTVQLFISGARRVRQDYQPDTSGLESIIKVCRQVQGMPLGILLASAWVATLGPEGIAAEIRRDLDFLSIDWADIPTRQRSLRATYDHSWRLLSRRQQTIFRSLSVFRGGFSSTAARAVCGASPHELRALADKSMLSRTPTMRYEVHELLRQFGAEQLAATPQEEHKVGGRFSAYYGQASELWERVLKSPQQELALAEMDLEHENLRAAWNWTAHQGSHTRLAQMVEPLCLFYHLRVRYQEGASACHVAAGRMEKSDLPAEGSFTRAHLLVWESHFKRLLGEEELAHKLIHRSQRLLKQVRACRLDTRSIEALIDLELGEMLYSRDFGAAQRHFLRGLKVFEELNDQWQISKTTAFLGICSLRRGDMGEAQSWLERSLESGHTHGDPRSLAITLRNIGFLHLRKGERDEGFRAMEEAHKVYQSIGDRTNRAAGLRVIGLTHIWLGRYPEAIDLLSQGLLIYKELGNHHEIPFLNLALGIAKMHAGLYSEGAPSLDRSLTMARKYGNHRVIGTSLLGLGWLAMGTGDIDRASDYLKESEKQYRKLKHLDELGWTIAALGYVNSLKGKPQRALELLCEALQIGLKIRAYYTICYALTPLAVLVGRNGDPERALVIYLAACQNPGLSNSNWVEDVYGSHITALAESLPAEVVETARKRGSQCDIWHTAAELIEEIDYGKAF